MDPNFGSIKMTLIFQKDCITCMDPKFGSIKMNLIVQICLKQRQVFCVKIWIHEKLPVPGSIKMNYNPEISTKPSVNKVGNVNKLRVENTRVTRNQIVKWPKIRKNDLSLFIYFFFTKTIQYRNFCGRISNVNTFCN